MKNNCNTLFISHGGGPLPLLGDEGHMEMVTSLTNIAAKLQKPSAILLISAHWEENVPTVTSGSNPQLINDYYGFPEESYHITYPAPGEPALAGEVYSLLKEANINAGQDATRGFDHGLFVPLKIMYPEADIPCVQLSLAQSLDAGKHLEIGKALQSIEHDNLLVVGSGFTFHNMREFFSPKTIKSAGRNLGFENWLIETCSSDQLSETERNGQSDWKSGLKHHLPDIAIPGKSTCCPCMSAMALPEKLAQNTLSWKLLIKNQVCICGVFKADFR